MPKTVTLDARGLKCPIPILKMTNVLGAKVVLPGDTLEVLADCPTFEDELRLWCQNWKKTLISIKGERAEKTAHILI